MKKKAIVLLAFAAALTAVSCQKENITGQNESSPLTVSAVSEGLDTPTKTELAFKYDVLWSDEDKIYVKDASGNHDTFKLQNGAGTTKGTFKQDGEVKFTGEVQAYYPATMLDVGSPVWPASQADDQTIPMYCKKTLSGATEERMDFSSLGSVLQLNFNSTTADIVLKSIEVKADEAMSGAFTVNENGQAVITQTEGDKPGITLDLGEGVALGTSAKKFNIAVPAGEYSNLTITFIAKDGLICTKHATKTQTIAYNTVNTLAISGDFKSNSPIYVDFTSDYEFVEYISSSYQICSAFGFEYDGAPVYVGVPKDPSKTDELAEKYGTVYYIPDYANNGYGIYFNIDKNGKLALPDNYKMQDLGIRLMTGVDAYMFIRDAKVSGVGVTIDYDIADQNGNILGRNYSDKLIAYVDAQIDDFVGEYTCPSLNNATVTVTKISDTELSFAGIDQNGPFKFMMDGGYPSFVGGLINETTNISAFCGNLSAGQFYSKYYNLFNYRKLADGMLMPTLTSDATYYGISEILILAETSQGRSLKTYYVFADLKLLPVENAAPMSIIPDMSRKLADYKGTTKTGLRFNGKPVIAKTVSNR